MKKFLIIMVLLMPLSVIADEQPTPTVHKAEEQGVFKGLMYKVWSRFRALSPRNNKEIPGGKVVATAGIRGAETTASILQPYWKDDRTNDEQFLRQLNEFADAQALADEGRLQQAGESFKKFIDSYPDSDLRPNAQFAIGMIYGGMGQPRQGVEAFQVFIKDNPRHPLVADAKMVIEELK